VFKPVLKDARLPATTAHDDVRHTLAFLELQPGEIPA